jgi:hypothetical protein
MTSGIIRSAADLLFRLQQGARIFVGAQLAEADLHGIDLSGADLSRADLRNADLSGANLSRARLDDAELVAATLLGANLAGASLEDAGINGADLTGANLGGALFLRTRVYQAKLTDALLSYTTLIDVDLCHAHDLLGVKHFGPSYLDVSTLERCRGRLPDAFLVGAGLPDWQIQMAKLFDPALRSAQRNDVLYEIHRLQEGAPVVFFSVFISYSSEDEEFCSKLHDDLQKAGVRCWFAPHDARSGQKLHEQIERAIHVQDRLLLVLSESSMASSWVKTEIASARAKEREQDRNVLFPIRLIPFEEIQKWKLFDADAGTDTGREVREYLIPDFSTWRDPEKYRGAFDKLVRDLRASDPERPPPDA